MTARVARIVCWSLACAAVVLCTPAPTGADSLTKTMSVSATVVTGCSTLTVGSLSFGPYASGSATPLDATAEISVTCSGVTWTLDADLGQNFLLVAGVALRRMSDGGGQFLDYNLYTASDFASVWGSAAPGGGPISAGGTLTHTVYGRVGASQSPAAGTYNDVVNVTLTF